MKQVKIIFRNAIIVSAVILLYGVIFQIKEVYIGTFLGSVVSILCFYLLCRDTKATVLSKSPSKFAVINYMKRYFICALFLGILGYYGKLPLLLSGALGLLNIKLNIMFLTLFNYILRFKEKHLKD